MAPCPGRSRPANPALCDEVLEDLSMPRLRGFPRNALLPLVLALTCFAPGNARAGQPGVAKQWNVLFLFSDDQRADTIAELGNKHVRTPNLDRLVHQGTTFTRAYC